MNKLLIKSDGLSVFKFGKLNGDNHHKFQLQLLYPAFTLRSDSDIKELFLGLDTAFRMIKDTRNGFYFGTGFSILGFGIALDYHNV